MSAMQRQPARNAVTHKGKFINIEDAGPGFGVNGCRRQQAQVQSAIFDKYGFAQNEKKRVNQGISPIKYLFTNAEPGNIVYRRDRYSVFKRSGARFA